MPEVWICAGVCVAAMTWLLWVYRRRVASPSRCVPDAEDAGALPPVSVIVYACDNARALASMLPGVLSQDYPSPMEVVVVNDGSSEDVTDVVNRLSLDHRNLYVTFIPDKAHNLSRKKLGISLGVKAARYPYVVLTCAECRIPSENWLSRMAAPFARGREVSLGFAGLEGLDGVMNRFDEALAGTVWLSAALAGKPYRGIGYNIGYKRSLFFDSKGFSRSLTLHHGDDDIFINEIADGANTGVALDAGAVLPVDDYNPRKALRDLRLRHCFTGRFLPKGSRRLFGFSTVMMWLWLASVVAGMVFSLPNALPSCVFAATIPILWIPLVKAWRATGKTLGIDLNPWTLPFAMMFRWWRNWRYKMSCGRTSRRNYTWLQH